jgi:hypothetical protein
VTLCIEFDPHDPAPVAAHGFDIDAVRRLFLGEPSPVPPVRFLDSCPPPAQAFHAEAWNAAGLSYRAIALRCLEIPDPWSGAARRSDFSRTFPDRGALQYEMIPLLYFFRGSGGGDFWLVVHGLMGNAAFVVFPDAGITLFRKGETDAAALSGRLLATAADLRARGRPGPVEPTKVVGLVDMATNFGHQMIHHLSGIQRLVDRQQVGDVDEVWIAGTEFFGATEVLFPELRGRLRRFPDRWTLHDELARGDAVAFRLGSNIFPRALAARIMAAALAEYGPPPVPQHRPLIAVTVRAAGRRCVNLPSVVAAVILRLLPRYPTLGVLIDGWVLPGAATPTTPDIAAELDAAAEIRRVLPPSAIAGDLVGTPMLASVGAVARVDAYLAHVGTLQHKIGFLSGARGVVHGPRRQLVELDGGAFQSEVGYAPCFLPAGAVRDIPSDTPRGPGFFDYEITDTDAICDRLAAILG